MDKLNEDLQDVTRIMTKNMEDLLWRGDSLDRKQDTPEQLVVNLTTHLQACLPCHRRYATSLPSIARRREKSTLMRCTANGRPWVF